MAITPLPNSPLWPPSPSNTEAASPGPQKSAPQVPPSPTKDTFAHHSSPTPGDVQQRPPVPAPGKTTLKKLPPVPMHVTQHSNPVGRPKQPRG